MLPVASLFVPIPRVDRAYNTVKESDRGPKNPKIAKVLLDSIISSGEVPGYVGVSQQTLINRYAELQYEVNYISFPSATCLFLYVMLLFFQANVIRATSQLKLTKIDERIARRDTQIKELEEGGGRHTLKRIAELQSERNELIKTKEVLHSELDDMIGKLAAEETAKATALKEKAKAQAVIEKFKVEYEVKKISLETAKAEADTSLKIICANLESARKTSKKNYTVGLGWKENCTRRNDFIADMFLQHAQLYSLAQQHHLVLNNITKKLADIPFKKLYSPVASISKPTDGSTAEAMGWTGQGSGNQVLSEASYVPKA